MSYNKIVLWDQRTVVFFFNCGIFKKGQSIDKFDNPGGYEKIKETLWTYFRKKAIEIL